WLAWSWSDVANDVWRLSAALRRAGFGSDSRLAVSGHYSAYLLLVALAARLAGGSVIAAAHSIDEARLAGLFNGRAGYVFIDREDERARWLRVAERQGVDLVALSYRSLLAPHDGGVASASPRSLDLRAGPRTRVVWSEESTDDARGLSFLLDRWSSGSSPLAFPETSAAAARDRREAEPASIIASVQGLADLQREIATRFAPAGSRQRRLTEWALEHGSGPGANPVAGFIVKAIRRQIGFSQLREIVVADGAVAGSSGIDSKVRGFFAALEVDVVA
ncbi:MAG: hypothetical protein KGM44_03365, partial [bacterium]|nr:hypothetical protein [bacterium]